MELETTATDPKLQDLRVKPQNLILHFGVFGLYLLGAIIFTWPLALNLNNRLISSFGGDVWQHIWHMWWARDSVFEEHLNPFFTNKLYHPTGVNFYFQALNLPTGLISTPFQYIFGLVTAFNMILILNVAWACYTAFLLARYITGSVAGALVAGAIYGFSPLESININQGQFEQMSLGWFPLFVLFFLKVMRRDRNLYLNIGIAALLLAINSLVTWYLALFGWMFCGLYLLYALLIDKSWNDRLKTLGRFTAVFALYGVAIAVVLVPTISASKDGVNNVEQPLLTVAYNSATLKGFFGPGPSPAWNLLGFIPGEGVHGYKETYFGYVGLILGIMGLLGNFRRLWFWAATIGIFFVLALGPVLQFSYNGNLTQADFDKMLPMPARLLYSLPLLNVSRVPVRFSVIIMLALGVLAAAGVARLQNRLGDNRPWLKKALPALGVALVFLEFFPGGRTLVDTAIPSFYSQMDKEPGYAVFEMPDKFTSHGMYFQTLHQHTIVGGYTSRPVAYVLDDVPGIRELRSLRLIQYQRDIIDLTSISNTAYALEYYDIRYIILHPSALRGEAIDEILKATLGKRTPCYEDTAADLIAYCFRPEPGTTLTSANLIYSLGDGWQGRAAGGTQRTTTGGDTQLVIFNPAKTAMPIQLSAPLQATGKASVLQLWREGKQLAETEVSTSSTPTSFNFTLNPGMNVLTFRPKDKGQQFTFGQIQVK